MKWGTKGLCLWEPQRALRGISVAMEMEGTDSTQGKEAALVELEMPWIQGLEEREREGRGKEGDRERS